MLSTLLLIFYILLGFLLIGLILMQKDRGMNMISMGGASQTLFGSQGSGSFMTKLISVVAGLFVVTSLGLGRFYPGQPSFSIAPLFKASEPSAHIDPHEEIPSSLQS